MEYSFKQLLKMFFTGKPNPYTSKEVSVPAKAYKIYVINFPDGMVTTDKYFANIPDYTTWTEPMTELFLLIVKDWRNWTYETKQTVLKDTKTTFLHKNTGVTFCKLSWNSRNYTANGLSIMEPCSRYSHNTLDIHETGQVVYLAKIWKAIHYGDKLARIKRIKTLRLDRIRQEEESKQAELNKIARAAEAQKIRDYLEGVGK